jgi:uridine phosphorylase
MPNIGPVTGILDSLMRARVLLILGEDDREVTAAVDAAQADRLPRKARATSGVHYYRQHTARVVGDLLIVTGPLGSASVEAILYELWNAGAQRIVLVGTAGAMPGFTGAQMQPFAISLAASVLQNFDAHAKAEWAPSWSSELPEYKCISTDRFYGFSPRSETDYPAEPALSEAWAQWRESDRLVDMEVAPFYYYSQQFAPAKQYTAIKVVANSVTDLEALPDASGQALLLAVAAGLASLAN